MHADGTVILKHKLNHTRFRRSHLRHPKCTDCYLEEIMNFYFYQSINIFYLFISKRIYLFSWLIYLMNLFIVKNTHNPMWKETVVLLQDVYFLC